MLQRLLAWGQQTPLAAFANNAANRNASRRRAESLNTNNVERKKVKALQASIMKHRPNLVQQAQAELNAQEQNGLTTPLPPTPQPVPAASNRALAAAEVPLPVNQNKILAAQRKAAREQDNIWNMNKGRSLFQLGPGRVAKPPVLSPAVQPVSFVQSASRRNRRRHNTTPGLARAQLRKAKKLRAEIQKREAAAALVNNRFEQTQLSNTRRLENNPNKNSGAFVSPVSLHENDALVENIGSSQNISMSSPAERALVQQERLAQILRARGKTPRINRERIEAEAARIAANPVVAERLAEQRAATRRRETERRRAAAAAAAQQSNKNLNDYLKAKNDATANAVLNRPSITNMEAFMKRVRNAQAMGNAAAVPAAAAAKPSNNASPDNWLAYYKSQGLTNNNSKIKALLRAQAAAAAPPPPLVYTAEEALRKNPLPPRREGNPFAPSGNPFGPSPGGILPLSPSEMPANTNALTRVRLRANERGYNLARRAEGAANATRQNAMRRAAAAAAAAHFASEPQINNIKKVSNANAKILNIQTRLLKVTPGTPNSDRLLAELAAAKTELYSIPQVARNAAASRRAAETLANPISSYTSGSTNLQLPSGAEADCSPCEVQILAKLDMLLDRSKPSNVLTALKGTGAWVVENSLAAVNDAAAALQMALKTGKRVAIKVARDALKYADKKLKQLLTRLTPSDETIQKIKDTLGLIKNALLELAKITGMVIVVAVGSATAIALGAAVAALGSAAAILAGMAIVGSATYIHLRDVSVPAAKIAWKNTKTEILRRYGLATKWMNNTRKAIGTKLYNLGSGIGSRLSRGTRGVRNYLSGRTKERRRILDFIKYYAIQTGKKSFNTTKPEEKQLYNRWIRQLVEIGLEESDAKLAIQNLLGGLSVNEVNGMVTAADVNLIGRKAEAEANFAKAAAEVAAIPPGQPPWTGTAGPAPRIPIEMHARPGALVEKRLGRLALSPTQRQEVAEPVVPLRRVTATPNINAVAGMDGGRKRSRKSSRKNRRNSRKNRKSSRKASRRNRH